LRVELIFGCFDAELSRWLYDCDALPLNRQSEIFKRAVLELNRTNLANWMVRCGQLLQPLINLLHELLLAQPIINLDETPPPSAERAG